MLYVRSSLLCMHRYDKMMSLFGLRLRGHFCRTVEDIAAAMRAATEEEEKGPHLINVAIDPSASRKAQSFQWLTRAKM